MMSGSKVRGYLDNFPLKGVRILIREHYDLRTLRFNFGYALGFKELGVDSRTVSFEDIMI